MADVRARIVATVMEAVDFHKSKSSLPATCFALMQNLGVEEIAQIKDAIDALELPCALQEQREGVHVIAPRI